MEGALLKHHSLSEVNRHLVTALADNPPLRAAIGAQREGADITPTGTLAQLARGASETPAPSTQVTVRHQWPPVLEPVESGSLAVIQPWEFGCIPLNWVDALATVDEFWVPSEWVRQCYLASGVPAERGVTIRNGIDLDRFAPDGPLCPSHHQGDQVPVRRGNDRAQGHRRVVVGLCRDVPRP